MIPEKKEGNIPAKEKLGTFAFFDTEHFIRNVLKYWYWFLLMFVMGYFISFIYAKYYAQRIYASDLSLSISNSSSSYFTPNQSINFIWGQTGNQDGIFLKKLLLSRTHNEYLVRQLDLYSNYSTKGLIKATYLDKNDSPVFLEIDKTHLQQVNYPITLFPKGGSKYEVELPNDGQQTSLYSFIGEGFQSISPYKRPANKIISVNEWYTTPNLRFKLVQNPYKSTIKLENVIISLTTINAAVNELTQDIGITFDKEISSIIDYF
ncbi:hypothetical protein [Halpernia sp. GG3]